MRRMDKALVSRVRDIYVYIPGRHPKEEIKYWAGVQGKG